LLSRRPPSEVQDERSAADEVEREVEDIGVERHARRRFNLVECGVDESQLVCAAGGDVRDASYVAGGGGVAGFDGGSEGGDGGAGELVLRQSRLLAFGDVVTRTGIPTMSSPARSR
jgi:hypothetical protein